MPRLPLFPSILLIASCYIVAISSSHAQPHSATETELNQALVEITQQLQTTPNETHLQFRRGVLLTKLKQHAAAIEQFKALIESNPLLPEPHNNLAVLYAHQKQYQAAQEALQQAIATHTSYATAQENLTAIYRQLASIAYNRALNPSATSAATQESPLLLIEELATPHDEISIEATTEIEDATPPAIDNTLNIPKNTPAADTTIVAEAIDDWAQAWSNQDVALYLSKYSDDFMAPDQLSLSEWQKQRQSRLTKPSFIRITTSQLNTQQLDDHLLSVHFKQHYNSNTFQESTTKQLLLRWEQDRWLIIQENELK